MGRKRDLLWMLLGLGDCVIWVENLRNNNKAVIKRSGRVIKRNKKEQTCDGAVNIFILFL